MQRLALSPNHANTLFVAAHPDDTETMLGYHVQSAGPAAHTLIATDGTESTVNHTGDPDFVRLGRRRKESVAGLSQLGVDPSRQVYLGLPDGKVPDYEAEIADAIVDTALSHPIGRVVTLGHEGYDGHPDHVATHVAGGMAVSMLERLGREVEFFALNSQHNGDHRVFAGPPSIPAKLGAMSCHVSQFEIRPVDPATKSDVNIHGFSIDPNFWNYFRLYHPLIMRGETYDQVKVSVTTA